MATPILRMPAVQEVTGWTRTTVYKNVKAGRFPRPLKLGERSIGWLESEVDAWQAARAAERDA